MAGGGVSPAYIWMAVTADRYELPLAVADTGADLAALLGISKDSVWQREYQTRIGINRHPGRYSRYKIVRVPREED